ncbi:hypothetical protein EVAR_42857_1 [Eumeta japonica]|uniref:Uncharacterized protein n=1 Tax=Eumeta variegata TaxID=151549 RepID=A0A4C1WFG5_EUMVA|nr:hypothetical protein EVAR_42857_1 [Eumeta japonica]
MEEGERNGPPELSGAGRKPTAKAAIQRSHSERVRTLNAAFTCLAPAKSGMHAPAPTAVSHQPVGSVGDTSFHAVQILN